MCIGSNFQIIYLKKPLNTKPLNTADENIKKNMDELEQIDGTLFENSDNTQKGNFELLPHIEKQLADCDVVKTSKDRELVGSERYKESRDSVK